MKTSSPQSGLLLIAVMAILLLTLLFSPWVGQLDSITPRLWGMPAVMWRSFLISVALVGLTWLATRIHPERK